jgi:hypothetical protein
VKQKTEKDFSLLNNVDLVDDIPSRIWFKSEGKQKEVFEFFDKIPEGKAMRVKFPDAKIWKLYGQRLRFFAGYYQKGMSLAIASRSNELGYFIYVKKRKLDEVQDGKNLEIKSV